MKKLPRGRWRGADACVVFLGKEYCVVERERVNHIS